MICLQLIKFIYAIIYPTLSFQMQQRDPQSTSCLMKLAHYTFVDFIFFKSHFIKFSSSNKTSKFISMFRVNSSVSRSTDSNFYYLEQSSEKHNPIRHNTPEVLYSIQLSGALARELITVSSVASQELQIVRIESNSNEPRTPYGFGRQRPNIPLSLNYLYIPTNPFNVMRPISPAQSHSPAVDDIPIHEEPFDICDISTLSAMVNSVNAWATSSDLGTLCSDEPQRTARASSPSSKPPPPRKQKRKLSLGMTFPKTKTVSQDTWEAWS